MKSAVLIDTHVLLWYAKGDDRLSSAVRAFIQDPQTDLYISKASLWEITIKSSLGKLDLGTSYDDFIEELPRQGFLFLDIEFQDLHVLHSIPFYHGDPFDRLIIAQAMARSWAVISDDGKFRQYPIKLIAA